MPPPTLASLEKRYYGCNYPNYGDNCDNGLSYGARVGIVSISRQTVTVSYAAMTRRPTAC